MCVLVQLMRVLAQLMRVLAQLMFSSSIDVFVIPIQSNSGCRPACRDRPRVCPSPLLVVFVRFHDPTRMLLVVFCLPPTPTRATDCITHIGFIKSHMPSVLWTEGVILSDRHGVCPYMRACSPSWIGGYWNKVLVNVAFENLRGGCENSRGGVKTYVEI